MSVQRLKSSKILGMAMTEQSIQLAEVAVSGGKREVLKVAEFPYPGGTLPTDFTAVGRPLAAFLRQQGFGTRQVVIGLPARWVMVKTSELPPADVPAAARILSLQAETAFTTELKELVYDFSGQPDRNHPSSVLLMALPKKKLEQIQEMATLARLTVKAILPSVAALGASMAGKGGHERLVLHIGARAVELAAYHGTDLERMRHVMSLSPTAIRNGQFPAELGPELRRSIASMPINGTPPGERRLLLWDELDHDEPARKAFGDRLGIQVDAPALEALGVTTAIGATDSKYASAVALANVGLETAIPVVNFAHSRMILPKDKKIPRAYIYAAVAVLAIIGGLAYLVVDTNTKQRQLVDLSAKIDDQKIPLAQATRTNDMVIFAQTWTQHVRRYQLCWKEVMEAFPKLPAGNEYAAYCTSLDIPVLDPRTNKGAENVLKGTFTGKANSPQAVSAINDNLLKNPMFEQLSKGPVQEVSANPNAPRQYTFSFTFVFRGTEK